MDEYLAHIRRDTSGNAEAVQTVAEHSRKAAGYAAKVLEPVTLSAAGYTAGLLHDLGKCTRHFLAYMKNGVGTRGTVNHTFAGVRLILEGFH